MTMAGRSGKATRIGRSERLSNNQVIRCMKHVGRREGVVAHDRIDNEGRSEKRERLTEKRSR